MSNFKDSFCNTATALLISLTLHSCQHHLQVTREEESTTTPETSMRTSKSPMNTTMETTTPSRKRSAEALSHDTEEKKESPTALEQPVSHATSVIPVRSIAASMTQASQESATMMASPVQAETALAKTESQNVVMTPEDIKESSKKTTDKEDQKESADLKRWFKVFAEAVDDEEVLSLGDISEAIPRLVQEGKAKGYLNRSMKLVINEVGWEPDCTPLHYAAAKGNVQAVEALLREPEVVIDAKTEENGTTPLQFAAFDGHLSATERLIGAYKSRGKIGDIDAPDRQGTSALQYAASGPRGGMNRDVAELLVARGADPTQLLNNKSPLLCLSASTGNLAMVEYWIEDIAHTGRFPEEQEKDFIERGIKLANSNKHTYIVITLQAYYKRMCT